MSATPLIRPLRIQGGTIYVFNSAANDISKTFSDDNFRFNFSKFAALDLPKVDVPDNNSNNIVWQSIGNRQNAVGATNGYFDTVVLDDMINGNSQQNTYLANSFQNYVLNWENLILNQENSDGNEYDNTGYQSITERLFWKWLADTGAIRFDNATSEDANESNFFIEELQNTDNLSINTYNRVVKYLGDVSLINNVNKGGEAYTQVYLHIPSEHGNTPTVLFKNIIDNNYNPTLAWTGTNGDDIEGRDNHVDARMSIKAYFQDTINDLYRTENVFGATSNTTIEVSNDLSGTNPYNVLVSDMDGVSIDWEPGNYTKITDNPEISSINEFNATPEAGDFKFNTVLIYYDIFDESSPTNYSRNLYGVLFIDDFKETLSDGSELKSFEKFKPNEVTRLNGNAYSLKTNIKFDTSADNVGVERSINEFTTFSMDLFSDAMVSLQNAVEDFISQKLELQELSETVDNLEKFYFNQATIDELRKEVSDLKLSVNNALIALESPSTILELIRNNSIRINSLANGELTEELSYNLDPFIQGDGIKLDKSVPGKIIISNLVQHYNFLAYCYNTSGSFDFTVGNGITNEDDINYPIKNNIIPVRTFTNYFKNKTEDSVVTNDVIINIDDTDIKFKTGQAYKIVFENEFEISETKNIFIYTDSTDRLNIGKYQWLIGKISKSDLLSKKPIIEIVCINEQKYEFEVNILR